MTAKPDFRGLKGLKKRRRMQVIGLAFVSLTAAVAAIYFFVPKTAVNFFRSPSEVVESPPPAEEVFRIGGLVEGGSVQRGTGTIVSFIVTDSNESVPVTFEGVLPDLFGEGQGMIALGQMQGDTFVASEVLAKHDETYMPKEVIQALKDQDYYVDPNAAPES